MIERPPNTACSNCLVCQGSCCFLFGWKGNELGSKGLPVAHHGVQDGEELAHASRESDFLEFASFQHVLVLRLDHRVVASGDEGRHIENTAHITSPTFGLGVASFPAAVIVHGCHTH